MSLAIYEYITKRAYILWALSILARSVSYLWLGIHVYY